MVAGVDSLFSGHVGWMCSKPACSGYDLGVRVECAGVIREDAESAKRDTAVEARRETDGSRARPVALAIPTDMAAAQAYELAVSTRRRRRRLGTAVKMKHHSYADLCDRSR